MGFSTVPWIPETVPPPLDPPGQATLQGCWPEQRIGDNGELEDSERLEPADQAGRWEAAKERFLILLVCFELSVNPAVRVKNTQGHWKPYWSIICDKVFSLLHYRAPAHREVP